MNRFVDTLNSREFNDLHPVLKVAYSHYGLVHIHPFADGNGRTARVLCSRYSFAAYNIPLLVYADRKDTYLQSLEAVSLDNLKEFIDHITVRLADTLSYAAQQLRYEQEQPLETHLSRLTAYIANYTDVTLEALEAVAFRIRQRILQILEDKAQSIAEHTGGAIIASVGYMPSEARGHGQGSFHFPELSVLTYPPAASHDGSTAGQISLRVERPVEAEKTVYVGVGVASDPSVPFPFKVAAGIDVRAVDQGLEPIELRYEDCFPSLGANVEDRLAMTINTAIIEASRRLNIEIERLIQQASSLKR
jgi:hypothetical protein